MEFTKTQTSIIVAEIVVISLGVVSIVRYLTPQKTLDFSAGGIISTAAVSSVYIPPENELFKKIDSKKSDSKSITIELGDVEKKPDKTISLYGKKSISKKKIKRKKESEVITIDLD